MKLRLREFELILSISLCVSAAAQAPPQVVEWKGAVASKAVMRAGTNIIIDLAADVQSGWHVYGLNQLAGGPTALRVTFDANEVAQIAGATSGTLPVKKHDAAFDLDTEIYDRSFALHVPVQINQHVTSSAKLIPVSVRFQACNDRVCLPPKTVHVPVQVEISQSK
jgi:hypothetical protein